MVNELEEGNRKSLFEWTNSLADVFCVLWNRKEVRLTSDCGMMGEGKVHGVKKGWIGS